MLMGGWEILLILGVLGVFGLGIAALIAFLIASASPKSSHPPPTHPASPPPPAMPPQDLEQQLRTLAKLKEDGIISEEDFNAKKKALLGI